MRRLKASDPLYTRARTALVVAMLMSGLARSATARPLADRQHFLNMLTGKSHAATVEVAANRNPTPPKPKKKSLPKPRKPSSGGGHSKQATPHLPKQPVHVLHP